MIALYFHGFPFTSIFKASPRRKARAREAQWGYEARHVPTAADFIIFPIPLTLG